MDLGISTNVAPLLAEVKRFIEEEIHAGGARLLRRYRRR